MTARIPAGREKDLDQASFLVCFHVWPNLVLVWSVPSRAAKRPNFLILTLRVFECVLEPF